MIPLTANEQAFITQMMQSDELARHGFSLLLKRPDFLRFFEPLRTAGLFAPERNPGPIPAAEEGYVHIPYWSALDYLVAVAKESSTKDNLGLANDVMGILRTVSQWRDDEGHPRENYQTARKFAEILGHVPTEAVTKADIDLIPTWLSNRFERMLVSSALDETVLPHLLASAKSEDWDKAVSVLHHATAIVWVEEPGLSSKTARTVVDDYWLQRLLANHVKSLASKRGEQTVGVLVGRVREVFATDIHKEHSNIYRAAIEDNEQNHAFRDAENRIVEALRDAILSWGETDPTKVRAFVEHLIRDELEILRRIAIYVMGKQWPTMRPLYLPFLQHQPFVGGHLHELYGLLSERFPEFTEAEQDATLKALRNVPAPTHTEDATAALKRVQQRWLSAITGKGSQAADNWMADLNVDPTVGPPPPHPDFTSYMTSWVGPGESPYSVAELVGFAAAHILRDRLNAFKEKDSWHGPTLDGLTSTLQDAARTHPDTVLCALPELLDAKATFQHSIIMGLQQAWDAKEQPDSLNWQDGWERLVTFFERLLARKSFWESADDRRTWVLTAIADFLRAGTQHDDHAYPSELLPRTQSIIDLLLQKLPGATKITEDPMSTAINTPKGRAIEAFVSHALRACRVADQSTGNHATAWATVQPLFDRELKACRNENLEFSTLCGAYLAHLDYLSPEWTAAKLPQIFSAEFPINDQCAIAGLAYASFTRRVYDYLLTGGVVDRALQYDLKGREARAKLLERFAAAYVWGIEALSSPRFTQVFTAGSTKELEQIAWVFWTFRQQTLTDEQKDRILAFWERCVSWARTQSTVPASLLSALSALTCYVKTVDKRTRDLLLAVAPYVRVGYHAYEFIEELLRLADNSPDVATETLKAMIAAHVPEYDYQDKLQALLKTLVAKGKQNEVLRLLERLRTLPGMHELFDELTRAPAESA